MARGRSEGFGPLRPDRRARRRGHYSKPCPLCGKELKAMSARHWDVVYRAHLALAKQHQGAEASPAPERSR